MIEHFLSSTFWSVSKFKTYFISTTARSPAESNPEVLQAGDRAVVEMEPQSPLVVESMRDCMALGRFIIRDGGKTIGGGAIRTVSQ